jgi:hypothetical protein
MAEANWKDPALTPEEKIATLILARLDARPPVKVRQIAAEFARIEEDAFTVACDAVTIRDPEGSEPPRLILNTNSTRLETRKRFTIAHEIGHLKIPWHCGSIACHVDEGDTAVSGDQYILEGEAHRFASELLMPTAWMKRVIEEEAIIERIHGRVLGEAEVSRTAARIKLMKALPPGFVCMEYEPSTGRMLRIDESRNGGFLSLFIEPGDRTSVQRLSKALEFHAVDGHEYPQGSNRVRWWRLDCRCPVPATDTTESSMDILRTISTIYSDDRGLQNKAIYFINGQASAGYQCAFTNEIESIYGALKLRFLKEAVGNGKSIQVMMSHPLWDDYLIIKAAELTSGMTAKKKSQRKKLA